MKVRICFMDDVRKFIIHGTGWETIIEIDISKYSHLPPACANTQIREEAARKGLEWFKDNPDDSLELSINIGIWEKKPDYDNANQYTSMQDHFGCYLLRHSSYLKHKKDAWIGRVAPYAVTRKSLQDGKDVDTPDQLYP